MFGNAIEFNGDVSDWDVSSVKYICKKNVNEEERTDIRLLINNYLIFFSTLLM